MERPKFKWCRETIEQIRFKPDRDRVWNELMAHIEDRVEDMKSRGYTEEEAEVRAVTAMGDPVAVGKQLDAVHKPWLGWLWVASKVLVIVMMIVSVIVVTRLEEIPNSRDEYGEELYNGLVTAYDLLRPGLTEVTEDVIPSYFTRLSYVEPENCIDRSDGYTFRVDRAAIWHWEAEMVGELREQTYFVCYLEVTDPRLTMQLLDLEAFYLVDSKGNRTSDWPPDMEKSSEMSELEESAETMTLLHHGYVLKIAGIDPDVEWVELRCERAGRDIQLRIYFPGGEGE